MRRCSRWPDTVETHTWGPRPAILNGLSRKRGDRRDGYNWRGSGERRSGSKPGRCRWWWRIEQRQSFADCRCDRLGVGVSGRPIWGGLGNFFAARSHLSGRRPGVGPSVVAQPMIGCGHRLGGHRQASDRNRRALAAVSTAPSAPMLIRRCAQELHM